MVLKLEMLSWVLWMDLVEITWQLNFLMCWELKNIAFIKESLEYSGSDKLYMKTLVKLNFQKALHRNKAA